MQRIGLSSCWNQPQQVTAIGQHVHQSVPVRRDISYPGHIVQHCLSQRLSIAVHCDAETDLCASSCRRRNSRANVESFARIVFDIVEGRQWRPADYWLLHALGLGVGSRCPRLVCVAPGDERSAIVVALLDVVHLIAARGHAAAPPRSVMNSRRLMPSISSL